MPILSRERTTLKVLMRSHCPSHFAVFLSLEFNNPTNENSWNEDQFAQPEQPNEDPRRVYRCGLLYYNPLTHGCCGGRYRYYKRTQKCCYGLRVVSRYSSCVRSPKCGLLYYNPLTQGCCGRRYIYYKRTQKCCYGRRVVSRYSLCVLSPKCGLLYYNRVTQGCCGGRYIYYKRTQKCCLGRRVISKYSICRLYG